MGVGLRSGLYDAGSPPPWVSGRYYFTPNGTVATSASLGPATLRVAKKYVPNRVTITRMGAEITTVGDAGSKLRLGIYADDGTGRPGSLVLDAGTINGDSATVQEIAGLATTIGPGWYWFGGAIQLVTVTQPTIRFLNEPDREMDIAAIPTAGQLVVGFTMTGVTGALPSTFTVASANNGVPRTFVKL